MSTLFSDLSRQAALGNRFNLNFENMVQLQDVPKSLPAEVLTSMKLVSPDELRRLNTKHNITADKCPICRDELGAKGSRTLFTLCYHRFCKGCYKEWAKVSSDCPVCKADQKSLYKTMIEKQQQKQAEQLKQRHAQSERQKAKQESFQQLMDWGEGE
jgi:hypothetical protein